MTYQGDMLTDDVTIAAFWIMAGFGIMTFLTFSGLALLLLVAKKYGATEPVPKRGSRYPRLSNHVYVRETQARKEEPDASN